MPGYLSPRAKVLGKVVDEAVILGPSTIGEGSLIDRWTCIGYPSKEKLLECATGIEELDGLSEGAEIGSGCVIRSFTTIYEGVSLGDCVETGHGVLIRSRSRVGEGSRIGSFAQLDGEVLVGRRVNIQSNVYLPHLTIVGDEVFIGPGAVVTNDLYPVSKRLEGVRIGARAVVGAGAVLLAGVEVGEKAIVAAGSIVTRDVAPESVVIGAPARPVMSRSEYEERKLKYEERGKRGP